MPRTLARARHRRLRPQRDRASLRDLFEVDARFVSLATLAELQRERQIDGKIVAQAIKDLGINADKPNPAVS